MVTRKGKKTKAEVKGKAKAEKKGKAKAKRMAKAKGKGKAKGSKPMDPDFMLSVKKLLGVQQELDKMDKEEGDKVLAVMQTYNLVRRPIYDRRNQIIAYIPDFWLTTFEHHPLLSALMSKEDHEIFKYLYTLDVKDYEERPGYDITFHFYDNPFFENTWLLKGYYENDVTGFQTTITWKDGMKGKQHPSSKESSHNCSPVETILEHMPLEVADAIREELWPNPLKFFKNMH